MTLLRAFAVSLVALAALHCTTVRAANCTADEQSTIDSVYANLSTGAACSDLMADSDVTSLEYCVHTDCIAELRAAVDELPVCVGEDETTRQTALQAIVDFCVNVNEATDPSASGSGPSAEPVVSSASSGRLATSAVVAQLCMAIYVVAAFA